MARNAIAFFCHSGDTMTTKQFMNEYKQQIIDFYDRRDHYDNELTINRAINLFNLVNLEGAQTILDVATGTGIIALEAAKVLGNEGKVVGIDFSSKMLERCGNKISTLGLENIELKLTDVDDLQYPDNSFDVIFCSSAIVLFSDVIKILQQWFNWLKPNGYIAFSVYSESSFFTPTIMKVTRESGYELPNFHLLLGSQAKCETILTDIGYSIEDFQRQQLGEYLNIEDAQKWWQGNWLHPIYHPLLKITETQRDELKQKFGQEMLNLVTEKGVWYENEIFYVVARK